MFRPCIDLRDGKVVQIVGGTLGGEPAAVRTNFVSDKNAAWFAELYKRDGLRGGLQSGGWVNAGNARAWLEAGASHVIVTSWVFREGRVDADRLAELVKV